MFFNSKQKDQRIAELEKEIETLKAKEDADNEILIDIEDVLNKFGKGLLGFRVNQSTQNVEYNKIKNNLNNAIDSTNKILAETIKILIEYGNANFSYEVETKNLSGQTGSVLLGIRALGSSISELLAILDMTSEELNNDMIELSSASSSLASASNAQAASLEETAAALEEVTSTISSNAESTMNMASLSKEVSISAKKGEELASQTFTAMENISNEVTSINDAIAVIDQISFQTNILSLNAAVEAATAGEAGKGFAVVAQEVRNLANRSSDAAKEIKAIVESAKSKAKEGQDIATDMINGYKILNENIKNQETIIEDVSNASSEQKMAIAQINDAVTQLDKTTQQNASSASQISSQTESIQQLSSKLVDVVSHTKYTEISKEQVCDVDMMFTLNSLKLDHINFKDSNLSKLNEKKTWTVKNDNECNLGKWIIKNEDEGKDFTKTSNWTKLKEKHAVVHKGVQTMVNKNNESSSANDIINESLELDKAISEVFWTIQQVKRDNCSK